MLEGYGYYRWSSSEQTEGDSKQRQTNGIKMFASHRAIRLLGIFGDEAVSAKAGANLDRQFAKMLKSLRSGQCIITENLDRISRADAIDTLHFLKHQVILAKNAAIFTFQDGAEYSRENLGNLGTKLTLFLHSELGHQENQKKSKRSKEYFDGAVVQLRQGIPKRLGGAIPSWISVENGKWVIRDDKATVIRRIFREYLRGRGMRLIAQGLNDPTNPTPPLRAKKKKTCWSVSTVATLLRYEGVIGTLTFRDEVMDNCFPGIIKVGDFARVQERLAYAKSQRGKVGGEWRVNNIFRSLARCRWCGGGIIAEVLKERLGKSYHYFACYQGRQGKCVAKKRINTEIVEKAFFVDCLGMAPSDLLTPDDSESLEAVEACEGRVAEIDRNVAKYLTLMEQGLDFVKVSANLTDLKQKRLVAQAELREAKRKSHTVATLPQALKDFRTLLEEDLGDNATRKRLVAIMPNIVKCVVFDLKDFADFDVTFVSGKSWSYTGSIVEERTFRKGKKWVVERDHESVGDFTQS